MHFIDRKVIMQDNTIALQVAAMRERVRALYRTSHVTAHEREILPQAFEELQVAMEELQAMHDEMHEQQVHLLSTHEEIEGERQMYQDLFEHAPVAYLVTGINGTIHRANQAAAALFQSSDKALIGRSLALFVPEGERRAFRFQLGELPESGDIYAWETNMQPWKGTPFYAALTTMLVRGKLGRPVALRWVVQNISERMAAEQQLAARAAMLEQRLAELESSHISAQSQSYEHAGMFATRADIAARRAGAAIEASLQLATSYDGEESLERAMRMLIPALGELCILDIIVDDARIRRLLISHAGPGEALERVPWHTYLPGDGLARVESHYATLPQMSVNLSGDLASVIVLDPNHRRLLKPLKASQWICAPLQIHDQTLGALFLAAGVDDRYGPDELALAREVANRAAIVVARSDH
jgi:PAS domain S-box-containing protein